MPRKPRRDKRRLEADPFAVLGMWWLDLLGGYGAADASDPFTKGMWERHRNEPCFDPDMYGERPWGWWVFDSPKPNDPDLSCYAQLARWGLLTDDHIKNIHRQFDETVRRYREPLCGGDLDVIDVAMGEGLAELQLLVPADQELVRAARNWPPMTDAERQALARRLEDSKQPDAGKDSES